VDVAAPIPSDVRENGARTTIESPRRSIAVSLHASPPPSTPG
jgi:hypothetical protein